MTKAAAKATKATADKLEGHQRQLVAQEGKTVERLKAEDALRPITRNALVASGFASRHYSGPDRQASIEDSAGVVEEIAALTRTGDLTAQSDTLTAQVTLLDTAFTHLMARSLDNMVNGHIQAGEIFARLALKAQSQARATVEALAKMHQKREQTVRHVHVYEGGQAVVAEQFHHHGGYSYANFSGRPFEPAAGATGPGAAVLGADAARNALPVPGDEGARALPIARGSQRVGRPDGEPECVEARRPVGGNNEDGAMAA